MREYLALLGQAERPDVPNSARRTIARIVEGMKDYMDEPELRRLRALETSLRQKTDRLLRD